MDKINYVLTTWSGNRREPNKKYLKDHLLKLLSLKHNLAQITIVKPVVSGCDMSYYEVDSLLNKFDCSVDVLIKNSNTGHSYGQLFYAYEKYRNKFDYYIFIEDDYIPAIDNFDKILLDEYKSQQVNGYLCSYCGINNEYPKGGCSVSNGMITTKFIDKIYSKFKDPINKIHNKQGWIIHKNFTDLLINAGLEFNDFAEKYRVPYYGNKKIKEYGKKGLTASIFEPNQLYDINFNFDLIKKDDLNVFLKIRNSAREFLHNNSEFNISDATKWLKSKPKFYMIRLNDKIIGYFRTSNWDLENGSVYIGCDLHEDFRGYGLSYIAYNKFIKQLKEKYNLKELKLEVLSTNIRAINLYNKLGFKKIKETKYSIRHNMLINSIIMKKNL